MTSRILSSAPASSRFGTLLVLALLAGAVPGAAGDAVVKPGESIGSLKLGSPRTSFLKMNGKPTITGKAPGGGTADVWRSTPQELAVEVVYRSNRAIQIAVSSPEFVTRNGLSTASTFQRIRSRLSNARHTTYFFDKESGKGLSYVDDVKGGLAFVFFAPTSHEPGTDGMDEQHPWLLMIHRPGEPGVPTRVGQGIEDPKNSAVQSGPRLRSDRPMVGRKRASGLPNRMIHSDAGCRSAVQAFYDWYGSVMEGDDRDKPACQVAVASQPGWFSKDVKSAILELARPGDEPLDADPFVWANDPAPSYLVRKVRRQGNTFRAEVHAVLNGKPQSSPSVVAELRWQSRRWVFTDFVYPSTTPGGRGSRLLSLAKGRRQ